MNHIDLHRVRVLLTTSICRVCVCPDGVVLTCQAYPEAPLLGFDSTGGCTPARPAGQTSTAADSTLTLLHKHQLVKHKFRDNINQNALQHI